MKAVEAKDFFASAAAPPTAMAVTKKKKDTSPNENKGSRANSKGSQAATKDAKKRKTPDVEFHDDPDFAAMLIDMDDKAGDGERLLKRFPTIHLFKCHTACLSLEVTPSPMKKPKTCDGKPLSKHINEVAESPKPKPSAQSKDRVAAKSPVKRESPPAPKEKAKSKSPVKLADSSKGEVRSPPKTSSPVKGKGTGKTTSKVVTPLKAEASSSNVNT